MRSRWIALACAVAFAAPQAVAQTAQQRVQAFQATCMEGRSSTQALFEQAAARGWTIVEPSAHPMLQAALERSAALLPVAQPTFLNRNADGMSLFMIAGQGSGQYSQAVACYVFDFDSSNRDDESVMEALLGRAPVDRESLEDAAFLARWERDGLPSGAVAVGTAFIVPGGPAAEALGISGTMLALLAVAQ